MSIKFNILFIPLDNRPVSYSLPQQIASLNRNMNVLMPPRKFLGGLTYNSDIDKILEWLKETLESQKIDYIAVSLDTVAHGGLIPSRRSLDTYQEIIDRLNKFKNIVESSGTEAKIYAFSSIMRISDSYVNEEEKEYWDKFGKEISRYSFFKHKGGRPDELARLESIIPPEILKDYLMTRERNFSVNRLYIKWAQEGFLDFLVYSKDDTGQFGLNVQESEALLAEILDKNLSENVVIQTGADEIPCDLISRAISDSFKKIKIFPIYSTKEGKDIISRYEDKTISENAIGQIKLCGGELANSIEEADILLLIHTPDKIQNDHCLNIHVESENKDAVNYCVYFIKNSDKPVIIGDVACANGADNLLVMQLLAIGIDISKIYAYAGWNTTGNTLGSVIAIGLSRFIAEKSNNFDIENFKRLLLIRLSDDWAYQTIVRQKIRAITDFVDVITLKEELIPLVLNIAKKLDCDASLDSLKISFPWNRTFEVELSVQD